MWGDKGIENRGGKIERREKITTKKKKKSQTKSKKRKNKKSNTF